MNIFCKTVLTAVLFVVGVQESSAGPRIPRKVARAGLADVCPANKIQQVGTQYFYKNNKPIRDTRRPGAPVVGNDAKMTLAGQVGRGPRLFRKAAVVYASNGVVLARLTPYSCKADHCTGRVVSSASTGAVRRAAIKASGRPSGYIKIDQGVCVFIPDIGRCYGAGVNMSRPLCDRTVS